MLTMDKRPILELCCTVQVWYTTIYFLISHPHLPHPYIFSTYVESLLNYINHPALIQEWKLNLDAPACEKKNGC